MTDQPTDLHGELDKKEWLNETVNEAIDSGIEVATPPITQYVIDRVPIVLVRDYLWSGIRSAVANRIKMMYPVGVTDATGQVVRKTIAQTTMPEITAYIREQLARIKIDEKAMRGVVNDWLKIHPEVSGTTAVQFIEQIRKTA
jgi:hypothetical protein